MIELFDGAHSREGEPFAPPARESPHDWADDVFGGQTAAMSAAGHPARALRVQRLFRRHPQRLFIVPLDHSITDGPINRPGKTLDDLVGELAASEVDAVILHKGSLRHVRSSRFQELSLIMHLSASTRHAPDPDAKFLVTTVEEAISLGADAVSVHVNLGSADERGQVQDLGTVARHCDRWNIPLLAMVYVRGSAPDASTDHRLVAHAASLAADLGADIVKTAFVGSLASLAEVAADCPIPIVAAGGPRAESVEEALTFVRGVIAAGAAGVAMGRNIFQQPSPRTAAALVARLVHGSPQAQHLTRSEPT